MAPASASKLREEITRRRAKVAKQLAEVARERAEIAALEEALRARVRDDELDRLESMLRTSSDEFLGEVAAARTSSEMMTMEDEEDDAESESEREEAAAPAKRVVGAQSAGRSRPVQKPPPKPYTEKEDAFIKEKLWEKRCVGNWEHLWGDGWKEAEKARGTSRICEVFTVQMAREFGKVDGRHTANPKALKRVFVTRLRDDYIAFVKKKIAAGKAAADARRVSSPAKRERESASEPAAQPRKRSRPQITRETQNDDLTIGVEGLELTSHIRTKLLKTTRLVTGPGGEIVREKIPDVLFCHRCKRTNLHDGAQFNNNSMCIPCVDRVKQIDALKKDGIALDKASARGNDDGATAGNKCNLEWQERNQHWFGLVKAIREGEDSELADFKERFIEMKQRFPNMVAWDREIFSVAAIQSKHPVRVINWGLANGASPKEINENAVRAAVERTQTVLNTRDGGIYVPALKVLKHLHRCNFPISCDSMHAACAFGDVDCVRYLKENVECCDFEAWENYERYDGEPNHLMLVAAQEGHAEVLKYLYDNDCDFTVEDAETCLELAKNRKPERAPGYEAVKEWIESLPEWEECLSEKDREDERYLL